MANGGWVEEPPRHFLDMDAYGPYPFKELPHDYDEAVKRYGVEFVQKNGTLPWRSEEIYRKLVEAFTQKATATRAKTSVCFRRCSRTMSPTRTSRFTPR